MSEDRESSIQALFLSYRESLPSLVDELNSTWKKINQQWDADLAAEFDRKVHSLAGSAATFDLDNIGDVARKLEYTFKPLLDVNKDDSRRATVEQLLVKLKKIIETDAH